MNIDEMLESERARDGFSAKERAAMWRGIEQSVGVAAVGGVASAAASSGITKSSITLAKWKLGALLSAAVLGGAGLGAAAQARWGEPHVVVEHVARPTAQVQATPPPPKTAAETPPAPPAIASTSTPLPPPAVAPPAPPSPSTPRSSVASARSAPPAPPSTSEKDPSLARERTLLDMGRTALSRGDAEGALTSLDAHAREFPSSQLAEEREVLAIQALASAGRTAEARRRGAAFRMRWVNSPLLPIVDEATQ